MFDDNDVHEESCLQHLHARSADTAEEILDFARIAVRDAVSMQKLDKRQKLRQVVDPDSVGPASAASYGCTFATV